MLTLLLSPSLSLNYFEAIKINSTVQRHMTNTSKPKTLDIKFRSLISLPGVYASFPHICLQESQSVDMKKS